MSPTEKAAARDKIAALRMRCERTYADLGFPGPIPRLGDLGGYLAALESLVDELTAPEPEAEGRGVTP